MAHIGSVKQEDNFLSEAVKMKAYFLLCLDMLENRKSESKV